MVNTPATIPSELLHCRPQLRSDVQCHLQTSASQAYYQLEDPLVSRFYRLGLREWAIASQLTGHLTLAELVRAAPNQSSQDVLGQQDVIALCRWLQQMQLLEPDLRLQSVWPVSQKAKASGLKNWLTNPVFIRIPLLNPDPWLQRLLPWCVWTVSRPAVWSWLLLVIVAIGLVGSDWQRFHRPMNQVLAPDNWLYLMLVWIGLKGIHEFYHGLICKKYGGHVTSCGIVLILFSPVAYVDVTSSWRFRSRWHRIYTAAGGMYAEIFVASIAGIVWSFSDDPLLIQLCHNTVTMSAFSTLLFNGNCLMKFDGYYILADLLEIQNLYGAGQQYVRHVARRYLLGVPSQPPRLNGLRGRMVRVYGVASLIWRILFYAGLLFTAAVLFRGAGIAISLIVGVLWFLLPSLRFIHYLIVGTPQERPQPWRVAILALLIVLGIAGSLQLPWPGAVVASGVVEYEPLSVIRAESPGFVRKVFVRPGQLVEPGQPLVLLENDRISVDLADVEIARDQCLHRSRLLQSMGEMAHVQVEEKRRESLERQRVELAARAEQLTIVAPTRGRVISSELDRLEGQFLSMGTVLFCIGDEQQKAIHVVVPQLDADRFLSRLGESPDVRVRGGTSAIAGASLSKVQPQATRHLPYPALAAPMGGPLAVVPRPNATSQDGWELVEPHFLAQVAIPPDQAERYRAGQLARVRFRSIQESVGAHVWNEVRRWVRRKLET